MSRAAAISSAIDDLLAALGLANVALQARLGAAWPSVVGPLLEGSTAPARLRRGVLTVLAENHAVAQEMQFLKPTILANARALLGSDAVADVRIVVGPVPRDPEPPADPCGPAGPGRGGSAAAPDVPPPPDPEGLDAIGDPETRRILRSLCRKAASRR